MLLAHRNVLLHFHRRAEFDIFHIERILSLFLQLVITTFLVSMFNRCMNISGVSCVHSMRMTAFLISLNVVGMGRTGECL